ncbi:unnamed protein product [Prunus brigantina]
MATATSAKRVGTHNGSFHCDEALGCKVYKQHCEETGFDIEQEEIETESHDEENEQQIHNPLKLPLGPDGKIISYWMYKLHGLGQEFKCEICGDSSYFGRRAFEIHFNGECHKRRMRCHGIPKTKSFNEIT